MASRDNTRTAGANRNQNVADNMLQAGRLTLETVQQVAALATIPYLSQAAGLVLEIFDIIQVWLQSGLIIQIF